MNQKTLGLLAILACFATIAIVQQQEKGHSTRELYEEWRTNYFYMLKFTPEQD